MMVVAAVLTKFISHIIQNKIPVATTNNIPNKSKSLYIITWKTIFIHRPIKIMVVVFWFIFFCVFRVIIVARVARAFWAITRIWSIVKIHYPHNWTRTCFFQIDWNCEYCMYR